MTDYTLHCFLESGNAYKPALMLQLCDADWKAKWINFFDGDHRKPEYLALNNMGEVPLLIDHTKDDLPISQSGVMLYHIGKATGQFMPQTQAEERDVMRWILFDNHKLTGNVSTYRLLNKFMGKGDTPEGEFVKGRMIAAIKTLNRHLEGRNWVATDRATIADISLAGYLFWPDHYGIDWNDYSNIASWLDNISKLPNYATPEEILPTS